MTFSPDLRTLSAPLIPLATPEITTITKLVGYTAVKTLMMPKQNHHLVLYLGRVAMRFLRLLPTVANVAVAGREVSRKLNN